MWLEKEEDRTQWSTNAGLQREPEGLQRELGGSEGVGRASERGERTADMRTDGPTDVRTHILPRVLQHIVPFAAAAQNREWTD